MKNSIELHWEWPDNRVPTQQIQIRVSKIKKTPKGLFGYKNSPSYMFSYPDSMDLSGAVISGDQYTNNKSLALTLPLEAIKNVNEGDVIELGVIESTICISITPIK